MSKLSEFSKQNFCKFCKNYIILNPDTKENLSESKDVLTLVKGIKVLGPKIVVLSDGPNGAYLYFNEELWHMPLYPDIAPPFERTGAGDAFAAGVIEFWANPSKSEDLAGALTCGAELGAHCVALIGARPLVAPE